MAVGSEIEIDPEFGVAIINDTEVSTDEIRDAIQQQAPEVAALTRWVTGNRTVGGTRKKTIFDRDKYTSPDTIFEKFEVANHASTHDDIVANILETTEQLAFKRVAIECKNEDEQFVWTQVADEIDLSQRMRECWRELFVVSQVYPVVIFGERNVRIRGERRKKEFKKLRVPIGVSTLDPMKVIPVGSFWFGQEQLVYIADKGEAKQLDETLAKENSTDLVVSQLITGRYEVGKDELQALQSITGVSDLRDRMFVLNPENAWRITATRPSYQRFADVRMESVFEWLDIKNILKEMDRSMLLGATNAIILVKKGDKDNPARPQEIQQLASQVTTASRVPIIVGDHRIDIEIITPNTDKTLSAERYNAIDSRITARLYQILSTGNYAAGTASDDSIKLLRVIASSMEARRDLIRDSFMTHIFRPMWDANEELKEEPKMQFYPRRIALDFDPNIATFMQDLRDRGDLSRDTLLAELDILQEDEAYKRELESDKYDEIFSPVNVPFSTPNPVDPANPSGDTPPPEEKKETQKPDAPRDPKAAGRRRGGNQNGGGRNPEGTRPNPPKS